MLLVSTYIAPSEIEGVGVFAAEPIKKGARLSRFEPEFDRLVPRSVYETAPPHLRRLLDRYSFPHPDNADLLVYEVDNSRFMNHSENPNTDFSDFANGVALHDIAVGEELTCNYRDFFEDYELLPHEAALSASIR
ncbi:MAG TPA: SET domain-containing protein-lysine N-methyltransferase, partial [Parvularculaceae bacterium]|nr:SET domain-containing protein-lysine N-methyltransferase [Parvularculaceae bacterium]